MTGFIALIVLVVVLVLISLLVIGSYNRLVALRNRYKNAEMDRLIDEAAAQTDVEKRKAVYSQIQNKLLDEAVMVFFADPLSIFAFQKSLRVVTVDWSGNYPFFHTTFLAK